MRSGEWRATVAIAAMVLLLAAVPAVGPVRVGVDIRVAMGRTSIALTAASLRLAFAIEHDCPESNGCGAG